MAKLACLLVIFDLWFAIGITDNRFHGIEKRAVIQWHELTDIQKQLIVEKHNELRRIVDPPAADMLNMTWHNGLEKLATDYTRNCLFEHNENRQLEGFPYIGENLFVSTSKNFHDGYGASAVVSWDAEKQFYDYETKSCAFGKACGHYTQTAWARSYKVGCGMTTCDRINVFGQIWEDATVFACNYAPGGNYRGQYIYTKGPACSQCPKGDVCVNKLCTNSTRDSNSGASLRIGLRDSWKYGIILGTALQFGIQIFLN